MEKII